jgi:hypothetical protein
VFIKSSRGIAIGVDASKLQDGLWECGARGAQSFTVEALLAYI